MDSPVLELIAALMSRTTGSFGDNVVPHPKLCGTDDMPPQCPPPPSPMPPMHDILRGRSNPTTVVLQWKSHYSCTTMAIPLQLYYNGNPTPSHRQQRSGSCPGPYCRPGNTKTLLFASSVSARKPALLSIPADHIHLCPLRHTWMSRFPPASCPSREAGSGAHFSLLAETLACNWNQVSCTANCNTSVSVSEGELVEIHGE